jgi:hypothetical protein
MTSTRTLLALTFLVTSAGFLMELWPLALVGIVAMGCVGKGWYAIPVAFLLDLAYGAPTGTMYVLVFPFTIAALAVIVIRFWAARYFLDKTSQERID